MARKKNKNNDNDELENINEEKASTGSKIVSILITIVILIILFGILVLFIRLDLGGFGSNILRPLIKDIPVVNKVLPDVEDATLAEEENYEYNNLTDAIARIHELESQLDAIKSVYSDSSTNVEDLLAEIERLKIFEENQLEFEQRVREFEEEVVFNDNAPDIEEYQKYYESIQPEHAEEIYRQVIEQIAKDAKIQEKADIYANMEPEAAARAFEEMTGDIDAVAEFLLYMKPAQSAAILNEMDPLFAAKVTKKMLMMDEE